MSFAKELFDYEKKRNFIITLMIFIMWLMTFITLVFISYKYIELKNNIGVIETTTQEVTQDNTNGDNNFIGRDGDINGKANN